jgi:transcriptional regulator GlxA family with amidase domain
VTPRRTFLASLAAASCVRAAEPSATSPLKPPAGGPIDVAFVISPGATVIDFTGPWEVFQDVMLPSRGATHEDQMPFRLWTVAATREPVRATAGLHLIPDYAVSDAPSPRVVIVPAHRSSPEVLDWIRRTAATADVTASVCTGAFALARAGLLAGREATTHHDFHDRLATQFPDVKVVRNRRYVESGPIATAAGLTSGIDLALRIVERYFGTEVARTTAVYMEHEGTRWISG